MARETVRDLARRARLGVVFTRGEALAAGLTPAHMRGPGVTPVFRGVFTVDGDATDIGVRARAAVTLAGSAALVCETTALALLGVELPDADMARTVHIWVPRGVMGPRMAGIRVHRDSLAYPPKKIATGLTAVNPVECWLQAAHTLSVRDLVVLADGLTRRRDPLVFVDDVREVLAQAGGRRGVDRARTALDLAREGTDSPMETLLRLVLVEAGLPCPVVNHPLKLPSGTVPYYLDMAYPDAQVAVEYDGAIHVADAAHMRRDQARRRWIEDHGWRLITATAPDLADPSGLVGSVRRALQERLAFVPSRL